MCFNVLGVVGSSLKMVKFEPTTPNMSQQGGQTHTTCCAQQCCDMLCWHVAICQQCCDMLCWHVAICCVDMLQEDQEGGQTHAALLRYVEFACCDRLVGAYKAPAKRSQHANATHRNIVGRNMLRAFGHHVATCCDMLGVVCSNLTIFKLEPTTPNMSQHGGQTHATCCAHQCCDMLRWHVAIVWPGLNF